MKPDLGQLKIDTKKWDQIPPDWGLPTPFRDGVSDGKSDYFDPPPYRFGRPPSGFLAIFWGPIVGAIWGPIMGPIGPPIWPHIGGLFGRAQSQDTRGKSG